MKKRNRKHENRVKRLVILCAVWAVVISVATYAWFIGMKTVNVSTFDVSIAAVDSLYLSLDGEHWSDTVTINEGNYSTGSYTGNTNSWGGTGLIPMSSVGEINSSSSTLIMYEKGSLTATPGGYRLMASQVQNTSGTETNGYVAFDLFIKNLSGTAYYTDPAAGAAGNEEAIYLTPESEVTVASDGVAGTGIENSVRVAFASIGRVKADTSDVSTITGIACNGTGTVTGTCSRTAQIWEPNDTKHVANAISWYNTSCKVREGADLTLAEAYTSTACTAIVDGTAYPTYAVNSVINYTDKVDVYDGAVYNTYTATTKTTGQNAHDGKLTAFPYFTDTMKNQKGTNRPEFIYLAPNSITKVRVYIWIEGQDIDNYDFASLGRKISVSFGFTKERFYGSDVNYSNTNIYVETEDTVPVTGKTYYTKSGDTYTPVEGTLNAFAEGTKYYERKNLSDSSTNSTYKLTSDATPVEGKEYYTKSGETYTKVTGTLNAFVEGTDYYEKDSNNSYFNTNPAPNPPAQQQNP